MTLMNDGTITPPPLLPSPSALLIILTIHSSMSPFSMQMPCFLIISKKDDLGWISTTFWRSTHVCIFQIHGGHRDRGSETASSSFECGSPRVLILSDYCLTIAGGDAFYSKQPRNVHAALRDMCS